MPWKNGSWQIRHGSSGKCLGAGGRIPLVSLPKLLLTGVLSSLGGQGLPQSLQLLPCGQSPSPTAVADSPHGAASTIWRVTSSRSLLLLRSASSKALCLQRSGSRSEGAAAAAAARLVLGDCLPSSSPYSPSSSESGVAGTNLSSASASWGPLQVSWIAQVAHEMARASPTSEARKIEHETFEHVEVLDDASE